MCRTNLLCLFRNRRYDAAREMVACDQVAKYGSESQVLQFPKETESGFVPSANHVAEYYGQRFPAAATSSVSLNTHAFPPSHALPQSAHQQEEASQLPKQTESGFVPSKYHVAQYYSQHFPVDDTSSVSLSAHALPPSCPLPQSDSVFVTSANHVTEYYAQHFPAAATSHASLNAHTLAVSYSLPQSANQQELSLSYEPYYPLPVHENLRQPYDHHLQGKMAGSSETNLPAAFQFSAVGGHATYL